MSNTQDFHAKDLTQFSKPDVLVKTDYETLLKDRIAQLNGLEPLLFDASDHQPVLKSAELVVTENGNYWQIPADPEMGLLYLDLESEPLLKQLQVDAYREMHYRNMINHTAQALMPAFATGADLDNLALTDKVYRLDGESDDRFRRRWLLSAESEAVGASEGWYLFHALSADPRVKDALALSPTPRGVTIVVLSTEGNGTASQDLLDAVEAAIKAKYTKSMTDVLTVVSAEVIEYEVTATAVFYAGVSNQLSIEAMESGFESYRVSSEKIGHWIDESGLLSALHKEGVYRVTLQNELALPIEITEYQAPYCTNMTILNGGEHGLL